MEKGTISIQSTAQYGPAHYSSTELEEDPMSSRISHGARPWGHENVLILKVSEAVKLWE